MKRAFLLLLVAATSCSIGSSRPSAGPPTVPANMGFPDRSATSAAFDPRSWANDPLPLDAYRVSPDELSVTSQAAQIVADACRARFGYANPMPYYRAANVQDPFARRYSLVRDLATARRFGYHPADPSASSAAPQAPSMSAAETLVTYGEDNPSGAASTPSGPRLVHGLAIPAGGCEGEGQRAVGASDQDGDQLHTLELTKVSIFERAYIDPRVRAAHGIWSSCMREHGYDVTDPLNVGPFNTPGPTPAEIQEAVTDVGCQGKAHLLAISQAAEVELQQAYVQQHITQLTALHDRIEKQVRTATAIVEAHG